ncbi:hypothetical protein ZWY2020_015806 [Hordeum vulgare]|nr:hypothetical protein ZWY2020_015806 [Hordeum vulgare]
MIMVVGVGAEWPLCPGRGRRASRRDGAWGFELRCSCRASGGTAGGGARGWRRFRQGVEGGGVCEAAAAERGPALPDAPWRRASACARRRHEKVVGPLGAGPLWAAGADLASAGLMLDEAASGAFGAGAGGRRRAGSSWRAVPWLGAAGSDRPLTVGSGALAARAEGGFGQRFAFSGGEVAPHRACGPRWRGLGTASGLLWHGATGGAQASFMRCNRWRLMLWFGGGVSETLSST